MARNIEKAQSMLYRFREAQMEELGIPLSSATRPKYVTSVNKLPEAQKWRGDVIHEISLKVTKIQDDTLTEFQIRDLNDEINQLFKLKEKWEFRIKQLGGADYAKKEIKLVDNDGKPIPSMKGYKYFGRARDLPGVKDLLEKRKEKLDKKDPYRFRKVMGIDYFGYLDEEDGVLLKYEQQKAQQDLEEELEKENDGQIPMNHASSDQIESSSSSSKKSKTSSSTLLDTTTNSSNNNSTNINEYLSLLPQTGSLLDNPSFMLHLFVPTTEEVEKFLLKRKQRELMERFT